MKKSILILFYLISLAHKGYVQNQSDCFIVRMDGYIITLGGDKTIFQPCNDNKIKFWEALDNTSFTLWPEDPDQQYFNAIKNIGDSVIIQGFDTTDKTDYIMDLSYFYCTIEITMCFLEKDQFVIYQRPLHDFSYKGMKYRLCGFAVRNFVKKIIPQEKRRQTLMYNYYKGKGYTPPEWLEKTLNHP